MTDRIFTPLAKYERLYGKVPKMILLSEQIEPKTDKPIQVIEIEFFKKEGEDQAEWHGVSEGLFYNLSNGNAFFKKLVEKEL